MKQSRHYGKIETSYEAYAAAIRRLLECGQGIDCHDACDLVHDFFAHWLKMPEDDKSQLKTAQARSWIASSVWRRGLNQYRRRARWERLKADYAAHCSQVEERTPLDDLIAWEEKERVRAMAKAFWKRLKCDATPRMRSVYKMHRHGISFPEIAKRLGVSGETVRRDMYRVRAMLALELLRLRGSVL
jgi:RNA polymerase sigma factor (sigma-70 family)